MTLIKLNNKIIKCKQCNRLVNFREKIANEKRRQYIDQKYWGKPITGYGDPYAKLLMIGLAPAAHGGNRTGRVFTGDKSAEFLFNCLYRAGFSNQPISIKKDDGLILKNLYLTTALKCVPPGDKPSTEELKTCFTFLKKEIEFLSRINTIVALGKIAFDACLNFYMQDYEIKKKEFIFKHGVKYLLPDNKLLLGSYHPSPRNVNTGRIDQKKMVALLMKVKKIIEQ
ncbi:MAG: uracil-DNA glycosylase [Pelagibacteraceae bacterium]|nr:uracil-DNA glycosylase [Pelagibacteraceae bacterium]|tara:strand:- start:9314 stop:9991 length:678 start_codon:yes stop_codon:yes gene_type:complete